jgi:inner membrane protease ATP23
MNLIHFAVTGPMVKFLREHLEKAGCVVGDNFIKAVHCKKLISGGYVRGEGVLFFVQLKYFLVYT